jgi:two-component system chemotaxis sensor kinase CheA
MVEKSQPDSALLELFRAELETHAETLNAGLISLEKDPNQPKCVEGLMRAAHSIKGAAKIVGFEATVKVAHLMEDCFVAAQAGQIRLESGAVDALLQGVDALGRLTTPAESSAKGDSAEEIQLDQLLSRISAVRQGQSQSIEISATRPPESLPETSPPDPLPHTAENIEKKSSRQIEVTLDEFILEAKEHLSGMVNELLELEKSGGEWEPRHIDRLFRAIHSVKGGAGFFGCRVVESLAHALEEIFDELRHREGVSIESSLIDIVLAAVDRMMVLVDDIRRSNDADVSELLRRINGLGKNEPLIGLRNPSASASTMPVVFPAAKDAAIPTMERSASLRVSVSLVDRLMTLAGELVLARNQALRSIDDGTEAMRPVLQKLDAVTSELQGAVTQVRMQPVGNLFAKFPRLVRDLARQLNKQIRLETKGTEVELDKGVLELLSDPLTHLIRNGCDHGIESAAERQQVGKPEIGKISLSASQLGGQICIEVRDDGRGLDFERIKDKAVRSGIRTIEELSRATKKELLDLILLPGFSTAHSVSEVSGRGVGMDVVKINIEQLGGTLEIDSLSGNGTIFSLRVPLTLAIIPCLMVAVEGQRYAIPQKDLEELICLHPQLTSATVETADDREFVRLRDRLLPLVRLGEVFAHPRPFNADRQSEIAEKFRNKAIATPDALNKPCSETSNVIDATLLAAVKSGSRRFGIIVDEILKSEEIVVKPMHSSLKPLGCYSGTTIMGDGRVALILNVEGIARHAGIRFSECLSEQNATDGCSIGEDRLALLFEHGPREQFAVPLSDIRRLVIADRCKIERIGEREFISIDGVPTSILRLDRFLRVSAESGSGMLFLILPKKAAQPLAISATAILDVATLPENLATDVFRAEGVLGTAMLRGRVTLALDFARLAESAESADRFFARSDGSNHSKARILLVEDTQFFQELIGRHLKEAGYEITVAVNGLEALRLLETQTFDLIISDIEMPIMDGWIFAQAVRQNPSWRGMPLLALTTINSSESREKAKRCGFDGYLVKLDRDELLSAVSEILILRECVQDNSPAGGES